MKKKIRRYWEDFYDGVYSDEDREEMLENDEISSEEEGFMRGYMA